MTIDERVASFERYCIEAKATDFYHADEKNLFLDNDAIQYALLAAAMVHECGAKRAAMNLICKLADGYREYAHEVEIKKRMEQHKRDEEQIGRAS